MILQRGEIFAASLLWVAENYATQVYCFPRGLISPRCQDPNRLLRQGQFHHKYYGELKHWHRDDCDCCINDDYEESSGQASVPIHVSRRKFVHYTSLITGLSGFSAVTPQVNASENVEKRNIIAVPLSPIAPFSTTRTYRTIILANGLQVVLVKDSQAHRSSVALTIEGAGQFSDPEELPGLAHLMEHIVLSSNSGGKAKAMQRKARRIWNDDKYMTDSKYSNEKIDNAAGEEDFEDWLADNEGDSNGFTAPGFVCFHFNGPHEILPEGLERFSRLFTIDAIETTVKEYPYKIPREIKRVDSELDRASDQSRAFYWLKSRFTNLQHPFSRLGAGSRETLQVNPSKEGIDVRPFLLKFFRKHYVASKATLVVIGKEEVRTLDRWISSFSNVMSQSTNSARVCTEQPSFPEAIVDKGRSTKGATQAIILRSKEDAQYDEDIQTLCMEWPLSLTYTRDRCDSRQAPTQHVITAPAVGFVLSQMIARRGPGSLRYFLDKFGWIPKGGTRGLPRISFPVDVSGFQVIRVEIGLTNEGFANRSAAIAAVFESIRTILSTPLQRDLMKQYLAAAWLHGYFFAPRAPDAISLAVDAQRYGIGGNGGIAVQGNWHLMPSPSDDKCADKMKEIITDTLKIMSDEEAAIISLRASSKAIFQFSGGLIDQKISTSPLLKPWRVERVTNARYLLENRAYGGSSYFKSLYWFSGTFDGEKMTPPYLNPLIPTVFRAPRPVLERQTAWGGRRYFYLEDANASEIPQKSIVGLKLTNQNIWSELQLSQTLEVDYKDSRILWRLWQIPPSYVGLIGLPLPMRPPESTIECAFVVQLISELPSQLTSNQIALANLWLLSFDDEILDLAELGSVAGIAYETSLNQAGIRLCFRGVSQTLPSYVRRFCRRFIQHHMNLVDGTTIISDSAYQRAEIEASRSPKISRLQKQQNIIRAPEREVGMEGLALMNSIAGGYLISQGDVLPNESRLLVTSLQQIFGGFKVSIDPFPEPPLREVMYKPYWKPRDASSCLLPGVTLISDACGRVPR
mmetsp:Transcript_23282/g.45042  ORF Transcript_23282/g.45042 Transcript_23282/m.45042 type:complete len:1027 (+) Transcript_23282:268-3348(+)